MKNDLCQCTLTFQYVRDKRKKKKPKRGSKGMEGGEFKVAGIKMVRTSQL
jgi:hypothetical protein